MDYSCRVSPWDVFRFSTEGVRSGDVLAFHDSYKTEVKLRYALPRALQLLREHGFSFAPLPAPLPVSLVRTVGSEMVGSGVAGLRSPVMAEVGVWQGVKRRER